MPDTLPILSRSLLLTPTAEAAQKLGALISVIDRSEPNSHQLYAKLSVTPSRLCGRHPLVLQQTITMMNRALDKSPNNAVYLTELAHQQLLAGDSKESMKNVKQAMSVDETSVPALTGTLVLYACDPMSLRTSQIIS